MATARESTRDRLLDAAEALLVEAGPRGLTLDAVAAAAAVSKGGLLYHFRSKDALVDGLLERLARLSADDAAAMRADPDGPVAYYLRTAVPASDHEALTRAVTAASTLASAGDDRARAALRGVNDGWYAVLADAVGDPGLARLVQLVGDGLWHEATTGSTAAGGGDVEGLLALVQRLLAGAAGRR